MIVDLNVREIKLVIGALRFVAMIVEGQAADIEHDARTGELDFPATALAQLKRYEGMAADARTIAQRLADCSAS